MSPESQYGRLIWGWLLLQVRVDLPNRMVIKDYG